MSNKTIINTSGMSDDAIIKTIGDFIKHHRLEKNITQKELSERAGVNRTTLAELESGRRCQLLTLIQVLRTLDKLYIFEEFEIKQRISPIKLAELEMQKRRRAKSSNKDENKSDW